MDQTIEKQISYFHALSGLLGDPKRFFTELPAETGAAKPFFFLSVSAAIFAGASLMSVETARFLNGMVFFANAFGMVLIASAVGCGVVRMTTDNRTPYGQFFSVYAFSTGVTILAAWLPAFLWITEPWKWWLISVGLREHIGLTGKEALTVILMSVGVMFSGIWWIMKIL